MTQTLMFSFIFSTALAKVLKWCPKEVHWGKQASYLCSFLSIISFFSFVHERITHSWFIWRNPAEWEYVLHLGKQNVKSNRLRTIRCLLSKAIGEIKYCKSNKIMPIFSWSVTVLSCYFSRTKGMGLPSVQASPNPEVWLALPRHKILKVSGMMPPPHM